MKKLFILLTLMTLSLAAQTTSTALKSQIDTQITNKTGPGSISKGNVGNNIKAVVDYADQQDATKQASLSGTGFVKASGSTINYDNATYLTTSAAALTYQPSLGFTAENISNKSTNVSVDGASNTKYPSVKAIKDYVDDNYANIAQAEINTNKSTNVTTDGASDTKYPSVKAVKSYVDANAVTKVQKTSISSAELLQLFTTPKVVLLNTNPATIKIPISIYVFKNDGNSYTLNNNGFYFLNAGNNVEATLYLQCLTTTGTGYYQAGISYSNGNMSGVERMPGYSLQASGGNPTGGTATLDVYVTYIEIPL